MDDVSMAREVTSVKTTSLMARAVQSASVCPKQKLITRSSETESTGAKDRENTTDTRGESKVLLQDMTVKRKDVNCVEKKTWSRTRISSRR